MTELYQAMVYKVWRVAAYQLIKKVGSRPLGRAQIQRLQRYQLDRLMEDENDYLSYLSFDGVKDGYVIYFDENKLTEVKKKVDGFRQNAGKEKPTEDVLKQLKSTLILHPAYLRSSIGESDVKDSWYFLHLAFQEYFAASSVARQLVHEDYRRIKSLKTEETLKETNHFINTNLFNPRFKTVWYMVAGLLRDADLERFFNLLENSDSKGCEADRERMIQGCLREALYNLDIDRVQ
ncbi:hypothetical protein BGZ76_006118, partial [Entomortierella beljakovae]